MMPMVNWVALLAEGVDRNHNLLDALTELFQVALLAEGVDRNIIEHSKSDLKSGRPPRGGRG